MPKVTVQTPATPDFAKVTASVVNNWTQVNSRLVSFAQSSLQKNLAAAEQLRKAQSPQEAVDLQIKLAQSAYADAIDEAREVGSLLARISSDAVAALTIRQ